MKKITKLSIVMTIVGINVFPGISRAEDWQSNSYNMGINPFVEMDANTGSRVDNFVTTSGDEVTITSRKEFFKIDAGSSYEANGKNLLIMGLTRGSNAYYAIDNKGTLVFNNSVKISEIFDVFEFIPHKGVYNDGILKFNKGLTVIGINVCDSIINNGNLTIKEKLASGTINNNSSGVFKLEPTSQSMIFGIKNTGALTIDGGGDVHIMGPVDVTNAASTNITLKSVTSLSSYLRGDIIGSDNNFKLTIGNNGEWCADEQTTPVTGVVLNGGSIFFRGDFGTSNWDASNFKTLTLRNFVSNSGYVELRTDLENNIGDKLRVESGEINSLKVGIYDKNPIGTSITGNIRVMEIEETVGVISPIVFEGAHYDGNGNIIAPIIVEGNESNYKTYDFTGWGNGNSPTPNPDPIPPSPIPPDSNPIPPTPVPPSPGPDVLEAESEKAPVRDEASINSNDVTTTIKRLNDIRTDPAEVGVWIRGEKGKNKIRNYSYDYNLMSGGYDWHTDNDARTLFYGLGFTYSTNKCDDGVVGDSKSTGYNIYGSWVGKKCNDYVDLVFKYGKLKKNYAGKDYNGIAVSGEYDKDLFIISTKYGRRFYKNNGFYFEPQVGYSYGRVGSADYAHRQAFGADIPVHANATTSNIVSLDLQIGKNIKGTELYNRIGYVYDLDGKIKLNAGNGYTVTDDMGGGYVRWSIGASRKVGKHNSFYAEIEKDFGGKVKKPYAVSLGYRHTF